MTNNEILRVQIIDRDEDALKFLKDIKWSRLDDEKGTGVDHSIETGHSEQILQKAMEEQCAQEGKLLPHDLLIIIKNKKYSLVLKEVWLSLAKLQVGLFINNTFFPFIKGDILFKSHFIKGQLLFKWKKGR